MKYIALLRGVNVGGKNKISMRELQACLTEAGFSGVSTYINSGNVLFDSEEKERVQLIERAAAAIEKHFGFTVGLTIITAPELQEALAAAPSWWGEDANSKHNAIFVIPPATTEQVADEIGAIKPECESIFFHDRVIFWSAPIKTFSRTRLSKVVSKPSYQHVTIRNANTAKKLLELSLK